MRIERKGETNLVYLTSYKFSNHGDFPDTIQSRNIFLKAKELSCRLRGRIWSTLSFMFYLQAIYLPTLQRQVRLWQTNYFVRLWFTRMCLYRLYSVPLLIRLANDVEMNPGPIFSMNLSGIKQNGLSPDMSVLTYRLSQLGLRPVDVGGAGDCLFRAVSHQLFGTSDNHLQIRAVGIEHLRDHPEHFIESIVGHSWLHYLSNMARQGTWCDNVIIQAVANAFNCTIHSTESAENLFRDYSYTSCGFTWNGRKTKNNLFRSLR